MRLVNLISYQTFCLYSELFVIHKRHNEDNKLLLNTHAIVYFHVYKRISVRDVIRMNGIHSYKNRSKNPDAIHNIIKTQTFIFKSSKHSLNLCTRIIITITVISLYLLRQIKMYTHMLHDHSLKIWGKKHLVSIIPRNKCHIVVIGCFSK